MLLNPREVLATVVMSACFLFNGSEITLASTPAVTSVSLTAVANVEGIAPNGTAVAHGGLDAHGNAYSSTLLGSTLTWSNITFSLGEAGGLDAVSREMVPLPAGQYSTMYLLATGVEGNQPDQSFTVTYSDGTTSTITQSLSDWRTPQDYAGESIAAAYAYRVTETGELHYNTYHLYGYSFAIDGSKRIESITLPSSRHAIVLGISLVSSSSATTVPAVPANLTAQAGNAKVGLSWIASGTATGYPVKRSAISGGPYTQVGASKTNAFTDVSVVDGTTYYYVVSAVDSTSESANSTQVAAKPTATVSDSPPPTTFGTWINVTPSNVNLTDSLDCGNYGTESAQADTANPGTVYAQFNCQGIWKSTDYGQTWTGPIASKGTNAALTNDCAGGITVNPSSASGGVPTIYMSCIRGGSVTGGSASGNSIGFWKSTDGGLNWENVDLTPLSSGRQDVYPAVVDPYDPKHLLMTGHEQDALIQSADGGSTWSNVNLASGMLENGGTGFAFFINTGTASSTRTTWLWMAQQSGGTYGTWRTTNSGASWTRVESNEHPHGLSQIYQPNTTGVVYMAGAYSTKGWGVLRSTDYGQTWTHVGQTNDETIVWGTSKNVYSMYGYPIGIGGTNAPSFELASEPGTGGWTAPGTPSGLSQGAAQAAILNNGANNIFILATWNSGLWRYVEP